MHIIARMHLTQIHAGTASDARLDTIFIRTKSFLFQLFLDLGQFHPTCVMQIIINQLLLIDLRAVGAANWLPATGEGPRFVFRNASHVLGH